MFLEDESFVKQCLDGDNNAFGKLVEKYQNMVHWLAFSILNNYHDAEDVVQEAFLQAHLSLRQLTDAKKFCGWLYKIARNISYKRRKRRSQQVIPLSAISLEGVNRMSLQRYHEKALSAKLQDVLESLPDKQRVPLLLSLAGYSYEEISGFLGVPVSTIRGRIARAKQSLREEILSDLRYEVNAHKLEEQFAQGIMVRIDQLPMRPTQPPTKPVINRVIPASIIGFLSVIAISLSIFYVGFGRKKANVKPPNEGAQMVQTPNSPPQLPQEPFPTFTDVTMLSGLTAIVRAIGVSCGDFDNDGDVDIYLANGEGKAESLANLLYINLGDLTFKNIAFLLGIEDLGKAFSGVFGDYDNDGDLDLYVANPSFFPNYLYRNDGYGFSDVTQQTGISNTDESSGAIWGDYNNDGYLDLYLLNNSQENVLFHNNGDGTFTDVTQQAGVGKAEYSLSAAFFDYDNDGNLDLYVVNIIHRCILYRNNSDGTFTDVTALAGVENDILSQDENGNMGIGLAIGDYDNDLDEDIYVANHGFNALFRNNGDGTFTDVAADAGVDYPLKSSGAIFFDYDKDGYLDLYVTNKQTANKLYYNSGDGTFTDVTEYSGVGNIGYSYGVASADFDNDGDLDIFLANHGADEPNVMYRNNGNGNNWLRIKLIGTQSNRFGIGAKVIVSTRTHKMFRTVGGGTGFCQQCAEVDFGLDWNMRAERVEVYWPGGLVETFSNIKANQVVKIKERESL